MLAKHSPAVLILNLRTQSAAGTEVNPLLVSAPIQHETDDPVFSPSFYAPYEAAAAAGLALLCDARSQMPLDVITFGYRLKSCASIRGKLRRKGLPENAASAHAALHDIVGLRVVLSSRKAVYQFADLIIHNPAVEIADIHDYIALPKPSGYRSLHLIARIPVMLCAHPCRLPVEIQLRTAQMDAWACAEHKLIYKPVKPGFSSP